jgi:hypothetical protein
MRRSLNVGNRFYVEASFTHRLIAAGQLDNVMLMLSLTSLLVPI